MANIPNRRGKANALRYFLASLGTPQEQATAQNLQRLVPDFAFSDHPFGTRTPSQWIADRGQKGDRAYTTHSIGLAQRKEQDEDIWTSYLRAARTYCHYSFLPLGVGQELRKMVFDPNNIACDVDR